MPPRDGHATRSRILDAAEKLVLEHGFAGTSIDHVIEGIGVTKGAFFYHFKTKEALAQALIERYAEADRRLLHDNLQRAEKLSDDPVQQIIIFIGLFQELADSLETPFPGCLFASFVYESGHFEPGILSVVTEGLLEWRRALARKFEVAIKHRSPRIEVDPQTLADMMTTVFEGSFILSRSLQHPSPLGQQLRHYRNYVELLFDLK